MKLNAQRPRSSAPNYSSNNLLTPAGREPNQAQYSPMCTHTHPRPSNRSHVHKRIRLRMSNRGKNYWQTCNGTKIWGCLRKHLIEKEKGIDELLTSSRVKLALTTKDGIDVAHLLDLFGHQEVARFTQVGFKGLRLQAGCDGCPMFGVHLLLRGDLEAENKVSKLCSG